MDINTCLVDTLAKRFNFVQITGNQEARQREITVANTNRPGLELAGFYRKEEPKRIVILGNKEIAYIKTLDDLTQALRFDHITKDETPMLLIANGHPCPKALFEIAGRKNFPVFLSAMETAEVIIAIATYLDDYLAPRESIHGVLMNVYGRGVMITGKSGIGKSELALELIQRGHSLVADDRVDIRVIKGKIHGTAPELLRELLEIRGIGVIDVTKLFGLRSYLESDVIDFVVELTSWDDTKNYLRTGVEEQEYTNYLGVDIPLLEFPVREGRYLAVLVEAAVSDFLLKQRGIFSSQLFDERVRSFMKRQAGEDNEK